jgi:hypothetical protein
MSAIVQARRANTHGASQVRAIGTRAIAFTTPHRNTFEIYATICHLPFGTLSASRFEMRRLPR